MGNFTHLQEVPPDSIFELMWTFKRDPRPKKIDLTVGIYYNDDLRLEVLKCVKQAEEILWQMEAEKGYLPIDGSPQFIQETKKLLLGEGLAHGLGESIYGAQTVGGTAALRVAGDFLSGSIPSTAVHLPDPTWANHQQIFTRTHLKTSFYPYYHFKTGSLEWDKLLTYCKTLPSKSIVLLHGCCHNPTGCDPTKEQWQELSELMLKRELIPFFDVAYQGFGDGLDEDAFAVRHFAKGGHEMLISFSYAKIFGLYGERAGALFVIAKDKMDIPKISSHIKSIIRANYSNPPKHGAAIVSYILGNKPLRDLWEEELKVMRMRIHRMRSQLYTALQDKSRSRDYHYLQKVKGMFCFTGLEKHHVEKLIEVYGIYLLKTGRINVTGLNDDNLLYVVNAINSCEP